MAPAIQEPTKDVRIDKTFLEEQRSKYPAVLQKLRNAIPADYYPRVEASQQDIYYGNPFYPGKVLLGTNDGVRVWAYLRKIQNNGAALEIHYDDNRGGDETDHTPFAQSQFVPWCRLVANEACPVGTLAWENRLRIVAKIVMLEAGYSDATVASKNTAGDLFASIRRNVEKGLDNLPQVPRPSIQPSAGGIAAPTGPSHTVDLTEEAKKTITADTSKPKSHGTATNCIKVLKDVIPTEHWFQTRPIATNIARKITLLDPDNKEYFGLFPGKVLLGHLRDFDHTPVWAAFRRINRTSKKQTLSGQWRMCFFDDKLFEVALPATLNGTVSFAPAFQLLTESKDTVGTRKVWLARVSMCARLALIDAGLQDDEGFATRADARPKELAAVIKKAWVRLRRTLQGDEQLEALPPQYRKTWKNYAPGVPAIDATVRHPVQAPTDAQPRDDEQQADSPTEDLIQDLIEISEDEDDIMESGYQLRASSPWPTFPKRELFTPAPTSFTMNKKQKIAPSDRTSLLDFINLTTAIDTPDTAALEEQVRALTEAKTSLKNTVNDMKAQLDEYKTKNRELQVFKAKHVEHCQAVMLKLLTQRNVRNGSSEVDAERDAKTEYTQVYGIAIVEDIGGD
ncbi:uncharacterized protein J4E84_000153 [Alternaria hordeiaustralica]|uniref:uncharacterized protein n=1 Tax=Alternaria hordeiaustralica TaxID=1187925 RepID=UPI0020C3E1D5|nr:uncharacterized protein J4E84_000153 [Alternaria hordeiaustralica]KAI4697028.1 hypothetical protein J4E84_000153 [Alternaria hordeiaustralica]